MWDMLCSLCFTSMSFYAQTRWNISKFLETLVLDTFTEWPELVLCGAASGCAALLCYTAWAPVFIVWPTALAKLSWTPLRAWSLFSFFHHLGSLTSCNKTMCASYYRSRLVPSDSVPNCRPIGSPWASKWDQRTSIHKTTGYIWLHVWLHLCAVSILWKLHPTASHEILAARIRSPLWVSIWCLGCNHWGAAPIKSDEVIKTKVSKVQSLQFLSRCMFSFWLCYQQSADALLKCAIWIHIAN